MPYIQAGVVRAALGVDAKHGPILDTTQMTLYFKKCYVCMGIEINAISQIPRLRVIQTEYKVNKKRARS